MISSALYMNNNDTWATPAELFDSLDREFHFDLDPCAEESTAKCNKYFTIRDDGLKKSWGGVQSVL